MNIYRISQTANNDYDSYDSAVVVAENEAEAAKIHPSGKQDRWETDSSWCRNLQDVTVEHIGITDCRKAGEVICASFNAG